MIGSSEPHSPTAKYGEREIFYDTDDVMGDTALWVRTNGMGDLHLDIEAEEGKNLSVYIRNGEALGKAILKAMWS